MLLNLYKSKTPIAVISLPVLVAVLALPIFFETRAVYPEIFSWQSGLSSWIFSKVFIHYAIVFGLVYFAAVELNQIVNSYGFYGKNTYLPGALFATLLFGFDQLHFSFLLIGYTAFIFGLGYLLRTNRQESALSAMFGAGLLFGVATVAEPLLFPIVVLPWLTLVIFRSVIWREWFMVMLGFILPWLHQWGWYFFVTGKTSLKTEGVSIVPVELNLSMINYGLIGLTGAIFLYGLFGYLVIAQNQLLIFKKRSRIIYNSVWLMVISLLVGWFFFELAVLAIFVPFSIIIAVRFLHVKNVPMAELVMFGWIALMVWSRFQ